VGTGREECEPEEKGVKGEEEVTRVLAALGKIMASWKEVEGIAEMMEAMGGQGYMMETGLATLLADGMVERIWEGTRNLLSLDVLNVLKKNKGEGGRRIFSYLSRMLGGMKASRRLLPTHHTLVRSTLDSFPSFLPAPPSLAREVTLLLGYLVSSVFLLSHLEWTLTHSGGTGDKAAAEEAVWIWLGEMEDWKWRIERGVGEHKRRGGEGRKRLVFGMSKL